MADATIQRTSSRYSWVLNSMLLPIHSHLTGRRYASIRNLMESSQWWTPERLEEFQFEEFRKLLRIAIESVPFYRDRYAEAGITYNQIQTPADIRRLPVLERDDVKRFKDRLCSTTYKGKLLPHSTGGSTGAPIQFFRTPESYDWRTAVTARAYAWTGAVLGERTLYLWGAPTGRTHWLKRLKKQAYHWMRNEWVLDTFQRSGSFWRTVVEAIQEVRPRAIVGYTSNIEELCFIVRKHGFVLPAINTVVAAAEPVYPPLYEQVRKTLGAQLFNTYGSREFMSIAVECGRGGFHVNMENIFLENAKPGEHSDLLVTDLHNYGMPFIRYRVGDTGLISKESCPCGRGLQSLASLEGKTWDVLRTPSGANIPGIVVRHILKDVPEVRQFQAEQTALDRIQLRLVLQAPLSSNSRQYLNSEFQKCFGSRLRLSIEPTSDLPRTASGKQRCVIGLAAEGIDAGSTPACQVR